MSEKEAMLYRVLDEARVNCCLCSHRCDIAEAGQGLCGRENRSGRLFTSSYGKVLAACAEPIERSRLYHVIPGTKSLSVAVEGSNLPCVGGRDEPAGAPKEKDPEVPFRELSPRNLIRAALDEGCKSLAFTYSEPTLSFEYAFETARLGRNANILNIMFTNGYMTIEALTAIAPYLDACSVEIRSSRDTYYRDVLKGSLEHVFDCVRSMRNLGIWVEVSTTVKPGLNDSDEDLEGIARFISGVDRDIPWHVARGYPDYEAADKRMTSLETLWKAYSIGKKERLRYIYIRNVLAEVGETLCPHCGRSVIFRRDFLIEKMNLTGSRCDECGHEIAGIFGSRTRS
jgi:pyruvate formate lyase activating enzyme